MEIVFDEILVGERDRAHDVLASSLPDEDARSLAHYLDLPGQLPPGVELSNYVSGFPHQDRYVFARTSLDPGATRQGMVFSHALVTELDVAEGLSDVTTVFRSLKATRPPAPSAKRTTLTISGNQPTPSPSARLCDLLATPSDSPVVIVGPSALEEVIGHLWPRLLPAMRPALRFRLSFGPEEADVSNVHIVAVPSITATRWSASRVVDLGRPSEMASTAAGRFITSKLNGDLPDFLADLSIHCTSFQTLELCCHALEISHVEGDFGKTLAALRLIGSLQPDPNKGRSIKDTMLDSLAMRPGPSNAPDFLTLRNFDLAPFPDETTFLEKLTVQFNHFFESDPGVDALLPIAQSAFDPDQSTEHWQLACRGALSELTTVGARSVAPLMWTTLCKHPDLGRLLLAQVASVTSMDEAMTACVDEIGVLPGTSLSDDLIDAKFVQAEAALLVRRFDCDLTRALKDACERDRKRFGDHAVEHVLEQMEPSELLSAILVVNDPLVTSAAAAAVVSEPELLGAHSLKVLRIQSIWAEALNRDKDAWQIRRNTEALRKEVFDYILARTLASPLVTAVASCPLGNALDYPRRAEIWRALPNSCRDTFLSTTASAWIRSLSGRVSEAAYILPEPELAMTLASPMMQEDMTGALQSLSLKEVLDVFAGNSDLPESLFSLLFDSQYQSHESMPTEEVERVARLVASRDWRSFTRNLMGRYGVTHQLRHYFQICGNHLSIWERVQHEISKPSRTELYKMLVETACELYPSGPMDSEIWAKAGGDPSKLDRSGTGQQQWETAIRKVRYGGKVRTEDLIAVMREDYPLNDRLAYLEKDCQ